MPQIVIVDEIGTEAEALACRTIAERGVQVGCLAVVCMCAPRRWPSCACTAGRRRCALTSPDPTHPLRSSSAPPTASCWRT